jgi:phosphoglycolate phosphatase
MKINPKVAAVIFDFDLTLADSAGAIVECFHFALDSLGIPRVPKEDICRIIGTPLADMFHQLVGRRYQDRLEEFVRLYRAHSDEIMTEQTTLFPSVPQTVALLNRCGISLGIVSTKGRFRIRPVLERENLLNAFSVIVGGEDVGKYKPDPQGLLLAVHRLKIAPSKSVYVGDSTVDAETALRARIPFIAVLSGATPKERFKAFPVVGVIEDLLELPDLVGCDDAP